MLAVAFDTLKLARKLETAGMQPKQAQVVRVRVNGTGATDTNEGDRKPLGTARLRS